MANKRYDEFPAGVYDSSKIFLQADASSGALEKINLPVIPSGNFWSLSGNSGTNPTSDFIGTSDNQDLFIKRNNVVQLSFQGGKSYFGTNNPVGSIYDSPIYNLNVQTGILMMANPTGDNKWTTFGNDFENYIIRVHKPGSYNRNVLYMDAGYITLGGPTKVVGSFSASGSFQSSGLVSASTALSATAGALQLRSDTGNPSYIFFTENGVSTRGTLGYLAGGDFVFATRPSGYSPFTGTEVFRNPWNTNTLLMGTTTNVPSSILTLASSNQGFLPPRMSAAARDAISSPAEGLVLYDITNHRLNYFNGSAWVAV